MGILEVFLIKLLLTQLTIGDQLQDVGHETAMPQLDPIMMKQLVENMMVASKEPMVQNLVDRLPVTDFSNFFSKMVLQGRVIQVKTFPMEALKIK